MEEFVNYVYDERLIFRIYKERLNFNSKINNLFFNYLRS